MENHVIVCGYGRVGSSAVAALGEIDESVVVIERDAEVIETARAQDVLVVQGDATKDETLRQAGIDRAKGLITSVGSDADNLFLVLSAKGLKY